MNFKSIFSYLGVILEILGILILLPVIVSGVYGETLYTQFFIAAVIAFITGTILDRKFHKEELTLGAAMVLVCITFIVVSLIGAIPYLPYLPALDAVFESVSGFTTTGLTTVSPESLPYSLLFWRSFTQWVGGLGILVIFLLLLPSPSISSYYLYRAEGGVERIEASMYHTIKKIGAIYGVYTVIGIVLFLICGMPLFDSVAHALSGISTGGFSVKNDSIAAYNNPWISVVMILLMILGATSFFVHSKLWRGKIWEYLKNPEARLFWILIIIFSCLVSLSFLPKPNAIGNGIFHTFSALTGSGFTITDVSTSFTPLLIILMLIGGFAGSTAGGIKLVRMGVFGKSIGWLSKKILLPQEAMLPFKFHNKTIKNSELTTISLFMILYLLFLFCSAFILTFLGYPPLDSIFEATSAQGTVGLSVIPVAEIHWIGKIALIFNMLLGRLEIFPFLALFYVVWRVRPES